MLRGSCPHLHAAWAHVDPDLHRALLLGPPGHNLQLQLNSAPTASRYPQVLSIPFHTGECHTGTLGKSHFTEQMRQEGPSWVEGNLADL